MAIDTAVQKKWPAPPRALEAPWSPFQWWTQGLGAREERALSDPSSQTETRTGREAGDTWGGRHRFIQRVLWGASSHLFEETSGQVTSVLPGNTCRLEKAPWPPGELGCSRGAWGGGHRRRRAREQAGPKAQLDPGLWVGWPEPIWYLSHPPSRPQKTVMRELRTHRDPRQKCGLRTGESP